MNLEFIDLQSFYMTLNIEEMLCANYNTVCNFRGHKVDKKAAFQELHQLPWATLPDGFRYKELNSFCERCKSNLMLYLYPNWPTEVMVRKVCPSESDQSHN